ncbi:hypothetical protein BGZ63DRAFT_124172 [Mariannaea sp. PMI_226]|nr:hypothetical protein BGZ63DRAFT_124172 [Mariannaea sp. PMI_226]
MKPGGEETNKRAQNGFFFFFIIGACQVAVGRWEDFPGLGDTNGRSHGVTEHGEFCMAYISMPCCEHLLIISFFGLSFLYLKMTSDGRLEAAVRQLGKLRTLFFVHVTGS